MSKIMQKILTFTTALGVSFAVTFKVQEAKANNSSNNNNPMDYIVEDTPLTGQQRLLASLTSLDGFTITGGINFTLEDMSKINIDVNVAGDISNFEDIKVNGDIELDLNGLTIPAGLGYFQDTMYFNYRENYFRLETNNLLDFVKMLPDYGVQISLPNEFEELDITAITTLINGMEEMDSVNGDKYFVLSLSDEVDLYVKTDSEYNFKGIRTDHIKYHNNEFYLDLNLVKTPLNELDLEAPEEKGTLAQYQDFKPVFNIFKGLYNAFEGKQNTIRIAVDLDKKDDVEVYQDMLGATLDISYDLDRNFYSLAGGISENSREHKFDVAYYEDNVYIHMNSFKISISTTTIGNVISYVLDRVMSSYMDDIMDKVSEMLNSIDLADTLSKVDSLLKEITVTENSFSIALDTEVFELGMGILTPTINFTDDHIDSIVIEGIAFDDMKLGITISIEDYSPVNVQYDEYEQFDPALTIGDAILPLINETQFRIVFNGSVKDVNEEKKDINIGGDVQFDIANDYGYGQVTIVDRDDYAHNIKADMKSPEEILFSYNDTMNGKFKIATLMDLLDVLQDIITNPDEHFMELFGELIDMIKNTPVFKAMNGDIGAIFDEEITNDITVTDTSTILDISLGIIGFKDNNVQIEIDYSNDGDNAYLDGLKLTIPEFEGLKIEINASLEDFSEDYEVERLDPYQEYMDFSDIKVLLDMGIKTSKFDYYHFSSNVDLKIPLLGSLAIDKKIPMDIQVRNNHGDVQLDVELTDVPVISLVNKNEEYRNTKSRKVSIFYNDGLIYLKRVDTVDNKVLFIGKSYEVTYSAVYTTDYFMANLLDILLGKVMGMSDSIMDMIVGSTDTPDEEESTQIQYEKILRNFNYDADTTKFTFKVDLFALTHTKILDTIDLVVIGDPQVNELTKVNVNIAIHTLITISISLSVNTVSKQALEDTNKLTALDSWVLAHSSDEQNVYKKISEVQK